MARTLGILVHAGAQAAEKSQEAGRIWARHTFAVDQAEFSQLFLLSDLLDLFQEGSDLGRAAYFLDSHMVTWQTWHSNGQHASFDH